jgi:hypothetical protein
LAVNKLSVIAESLLNLRRFFLDAHGRLHLMEETDNFIDSNTILYNKGAYRGFI